MRYRASPQIQRGSQEPPTFLKLSLNFRETFVKLGPRQAAHEILGEARAETHEILGGRPEAWTQEILGGGPGA